MDGAFLTYGTAEDVAGHLATIPRKLTVEELTAALINALVKIDTLQKRVDRLEQRRISRRNENPKPVIERKTATCHQCGATIYLVPRIRSGRWQTNPKKPDSSWHCGNDPMRPVLAHAPHWEEGPK
jgi:hypothetical protein